MRVRARRSCVRTCVGVCTSACANALVRVFPFVRLPGMPRVYDYACACVHKCVCAFVGLSGMQRVYDRMHVRAVMYVFVLSWDCAL